VSSRRPESARNYAWPFNCTYQPVSFRQFLYGLLLLFVVLLISETTTDPDLWGHVRFGQDMLERGSIRLSDTYSFTSDRQWVNHEWLAEILMAGSFQFAGPAGLNVLRIAIIGCVLALVWYASAGISSRQKVLVITVGAIGMYMRALPIRPQLFSLLLFAVLLTLLNRADERRSLQLVACVPLVMALWVNLHGGWIVGFAIFSLWCLLSAAATSSRTRAILLSALVAAGASTLANPYGFGMWNFLATTVRLERPLIGDWLPLYAVPPHVWVSWLAAFALTAFAVARSRSSVDRKQLTIVVVLGVMSVRLSRLDAFFAIAAMFFAVRALKQARVVMISAPGNPERRLPVLAYAFAICVAAIAAAIVPRVTTVPSRSDLVPDSNVAVYVREQELRGNVLVWFDWGEYSIWHFGPDLKVSIDGRRETVYSAELIDAHMQFYFGKEEEWRYADVIDADYVWLPRQLVIARQLQRNGWFSLCEGPASILLTRRPVVHPCAGHQTSTSRVFPEL